MNLTTEAQFKIVNNSLPMDPILETLVVLSRSLGEEGRELVILAEGNVSAIIDDDHFLVKASGMQLGHATEHSFVRVRFAPILKAFGGANLDDAMTRLLLSKSRVDPKVTLMPSVETFMHAYLLKLPGVTLVGHTHPTPLISLLSLTSAIELAKQRLFPDEVVCCGPESAFVPYTDPGLPLARAIQASVEDYVDRWGSIPKTIWLQNHGLIVLGRSKSEIESASFMAIKSAKVWLGALAANQSLSPLSKDQISRIHTRPDEHYRQQLLWKLQQTQNS